jgi:RNA-directed DNA polymerase
MPTSQAKPFDIPKQQVWEAYRRVAANKGAPGVDEVALEDFESDLKNNLYKVWNRMSSGSYFPPPVKGVEIPKPHGGGVRLLGVPTIADRVAQTVVAMHLEERAEPRFHPDSYGYRPKRSAHDAVEACRKRCWNYDWVIDLDVEKFFDTVPWNLVQKAVEAVCDTPWVLLYVKRWLAAPLQFQDGSLVERDRGTPQGSAVSPILANLFMHFAFDTWMTRNYPSYPFERYADDAVVHCASRRQAAAVLAGITERMEEVGLRLHPDKTHIVYCKDGRRRGEHEHTSFTYLGFTFRARGARNRKDGSVFTSFIPAMSTEALEAKSAELRSMRIHRRTTLTLGELARWLNPIVSGWIQYYGRFYRSAMYPLLQRINTYLRRWAGRKYRRLRALKRFTRWWDQVLDRAPGLFAQWQWVRAF